ncbi:MAG: ribosomal protein S18-alanine N-acetyltransferase [Firmicutes bacterium]|nr:ribosomal protein S18-alanine N-acetyltransferase [Bacillota bacterium]
MNPMIRYMNHEDIPKVAAAEKLVLGHTLGESTLQRELDENPFAHYFLLEDGEGQVLVGLISLWIDTPQAQIINLLIMPEFQGQNFSVMLMDFMIDYLKSYEVTEITLEVRQSNIRAIRLYEKYGFVQVAIRRQYYDNGEDAFLMLKRM